MLALLSEKTHDWATASGGWLMSGKFKPRCPRCRQRTVTRFRLELDAFLYDRCLSAVLAGAPRE